MRASAGPTPNVAVSAPMHDLLHTPSIPEDQHFHDSSDCPHGAGITRYEDSPSAEYPRRCNWCTEHDRPTPS